MNVFDIDSSENLYNHYKGTKISNGTIEEVVDGVALVSTPALYLCGHEKWELDQHSIKQLHELAGVNEYKTRTEISIKSSPDELEFVHFDGIKLVSNSQITIDSEYHYHTFYLKGYFESPYIQIKTQTTTLDGCNLKTDTLECIEATRCLVNCDVEAKKIQIAQKDFSEVLQKLFPKLKGFKTIDEIYSEAHERRFVYPGYRELIKGSKAIDICLTGVYLNVTLHKEDYEEILKDFGMPWVKEVVLYTPEGDSEDSAYESNNLRICCERI